MRSIWTIGTWLFTDQLLSMMLIFMALAMIVAPAAKPGPPAITIELYWDLAVDADVDLRAIAPGESTPVFYNNRQGEVLSLMRDDLGRSASADSRNYELIQAFGYHAGEWAANAYLYRFRSGPLPINVHMVVSRKRPDGSSVVLLDTHAQLAQQSQELTLARWQMDDRGNIIPGSVNDLPLEMGTP